MSLEQEMRTVAEPPMYPRWMTARRSAAIAGTAVAMAVAVAQTHSGRAVTADPAKQTAALMATPTTSGSAVRERPRGVVADCSKGSGVPQGSLNVFRGRANLVVGPLAVVGAGLPGFTPTTSAETSSRYTSGPATE